jgi:hypothetical protein
VDCAPACARLHLPQSVLQSQSRRHDKPGLIHFFQKCMRLGLVNDVMAIERRYRLGTEEAKNLAALERLAPEEKRKALVALEGTMSAQLKPGADISHTLKAIEKLDGDPRRIASYLYRLERDGQHEMVEQFARSLPEGSLKDSLAGLLTQSQATLSDAQKKTVASIQKALALVA